VGYAFRVPHSPRVAIAQRDVSPLGAVVGEHRVLAM
jgi:hypothetical protein